MTQRLQRLQILNQLAQQQTEFDVSREFHISSAALNKAFLYSKLITEMSNQPMEAYGYLLKPKGSLDDVITDVYLADNQSAESAYVRVSPEGVARSVRIIDSMNYEIAGWWHSHGTMSTFHSDTDVRNFQKVLNGIAPHTMFKTSEAVFTTEDDLLEFDNYTLSGVQVSDDARILRKIERDPFAYSLVVNVREEFYLEHMSKTKVNGEFLRNSPTRPRMFVFNDPESVSYTLTNIEKDIRNKISISGVFYRERVRGPDFSKEYQELGRQFFGCAIDYISSGGEHSHMITSILGANPEEMLYESLVNEEFANLNDPLSEEEFIADFMERFSYTSMQELNSGEKLEIFELRNTVFLEFVQNFLIDPDTAVAMGKDQASRLEDCYFLAQEVQWAMAEYAMGEHIDFDKRYDHKYRKFVANIVDKMVGTDYCDFSHAVKFSKRRPKAGVRDFFLLPQRSYVCYQLTDDLFRGNLDENFVTFLTDFPVLYQEDAHQVDGLIESHLLSGNKLRRYKTR